MYNSKVSIITPSFNQAQYLEETIISVLNQTYDNIEYIIIDGGSTDGSASIIKRYDKKISFWISEKDQGQADAINKGFAQATGDYICWINSDDILYPHFVERMMNVFKEKPDIEFVYGDVEQGKDLEHKVLRKGRKVTPRQVIRDIDVPIPQQVTMWRASVIKKIGVLDTRWNVLLDRDFFTRIVLNCKIIYIPECLAFFRNHEQSKSISQEFEWVRELPKYYHDLYNKSDIPEDFMRYKKQTLINTFLVCRSICTTQKMIPLAEEFLKKAKSEHYFLFLFIIFKKQFILPFYRKFIHNG